MTITGSFFQQAVPIPPSRGPEFTMENVLRNQVGLPLKINSNCVKETGYSTYCTVLLIEQAKVIGINRNQNSS